MQAYVYRVSVTAQQSPTGRRRWAVSRLWSNSRIDYMGQYRFRRWAVFVAKILAEDRLRIQGDNLRLEVSGPDKIHHVYGRDPRSTR